MEQNQKQKHTGWLRLAVIVLLVLAVVMLFRQDLPSVLESLRQVPAGALALMAALEAGYFVMDARIMQELTGAGGRRLPFLQALECTMLGVFSGVCTVSAGSLPVQGYYLSRRGVSPGRCVGLVAVEYTFQKATVLLYATVMLALQGGWLLAGGGLGSYILLGYGVCALVIVGLLLACTWKKAQECLLWCIGKLPDSGKWPARKASWREMLDALYGEARGLLADRGLCARLLACNVLKFFLLYTVAYTSVRTLAGPVLTFVQAQALAALMLLITNALPNVAGMGPTEVAFVLLFSPYVGSIRATAAMLVYRSVTYALPFLVSILFFLRVSRSQLRADRQP